MPNNALITRVLPVSISVDIVNPKLCSNCNDIYKISTSIKNKSIPFCNRFKCELHGSWNALNRCRECLNIFGITIDARR